ncbi:cytochrome P450 [Actinocrispum sp. NPDC049592]|uniref:cytochrome P450 n=1 Tax=Actinocrispum sp. NPDC049592 TaxID=3154835 RepID=UPI00341F65BB
MTHINGLPTERRCPLDPADGLKGLEPVVRMTYPDGHEGWLVTGRHEAREVLASPAMSNRIDLARSPVPRAIAADADFRIPPGMFNRMDPPGHTRVRRLLISEFTVHRMNQLAPHISEIAERHLDEMERMGPPADLVPAFALPIPSLVICELLGIPYDRRETFQQSAATMLRIDVAADVAIKAWNELRALLTEVVNAKLAQPTDDLLGRLCAKDELTREELVTIATVLLIAGHETTANMLALGTYALLRHPDQRQAMLDDPARAVEEMLRYLSIIHIGPVRTALRDVDIEGNHIAAGESVTISVPAVNRDEAKFAHPDALDLTRDAHGHLAFGHGIHQCLGQQLARIEMRVGYSALLRRFPSLRLAGDVRFRSEMAIYGVYTLPVTWDNA